MNQYVPDWSSSMGDAYAAMNGGDDDGLIELLWCNGHVVMQSQAPRKPPRPDKSPAAAAQDDEAAAWFQYPVAAAEDPLERDLFSELFGDAEAADAGGGRPCKEEECAGDAAAGAAPQSGLMPPPPPPREKACCLGDLGDVSDGGGECATAAPAAEVGESSMLTIGSSFCGSNHVQTPRAVAPPPRTHHGGGKAGGGKARDAATVTSSSMQPRSCTTRTGQPSAAAHRSGKRKPASDAAENEEVEFESADATCEAPAQKMTTAKRRRAAEVHNLSERRRRDRINEKMKALQELIPHCNKTDKASMLDEAIEYLKSLQLQLQMMWMSGGMAAAAAAAPPVMFPVGVQQYMQRVAVGPPHVASMPRMPFMAPPAVQSSPVADPYGRYLAVDHLQPPPPQAMVQQHYQQGMGFYQHQQQQSPAMPPPPPAVPAASMPAATARTTLPSDGILHKKIRKLWQA